MSIAGFASSFVDCCFCNVSFDVKSPWWVEFLDTGYFL